MEKLYEIAEQIIDSRKHEIPQKLIKLKGNISFFFKKILKI